jgi:hypothetical protein
VGGVCSVLIVFSPRPGYAERYPGGRYAALAFGRLYRYYSGMTTPKQHKLLSASQVAAILGIRKQRVYELAAKFKHIGYRIGQAGETPVFHESDIPALRDARASIRRGRPRKKPEAIPAKIPVKKRASR